MKNLLLPVAFLVLFSACKKTNPSANDHLLGTWKQTAGTVKYYVKSTDRDTTVDYFKNLASCYKDDLLTLKNEESGFITYGSESCDSTYPKTEKITWGTGYTNENGKSEKLLQITGGGWRYFHESSPYHLIVTGEVGNTFTVYYFSEGFESGADSKYLYYTNTYTRQ